ncbi:penicillin-binding protein activator [Oecophyllibacter saccharovorans]|nr:penicillin-binding protein activator [Oecophyllibacter saccharovorans]
MQGVSLLLATALCMSLAACSGGGGKQGSHALSPETVTPKGPRVGLILPLSGAHAAIGQRMRQAARLALPPSQKIALDVFDSAPPSNGTQAAHKAVSAGDSIVLGPLMGGATEQAADVLQPAQLPELAFTSDSQQARPGVWVMGLTPEQQVDRLVQAAVAAGRHRFAAFLPESPLGHAMASALAEACQHAALEPPHIVFHDATPESVTQGMADLSEIALRRPPDLSDKPDSTTPAQDSSASEPSAVDPVVEKETAEALEEAPKVRIPLPRVPMGPPPFDALLLADTGVNLGRVIAAMKQDDVRSSQVQIMGPALWRSFDTKLGALKGAWYAGLDTSQRGGYVRQYTALYHQAPSPVTDFAYDTAALAGALISQHSLSVERLTDPDGFVGVNGWFRLLPNGHVLRGLNLYEIVPGGGSRLISPASASTPEKAAPAPAAKL